MVVMRTDYGATYNVINVRRMVSDGTEATGALTTAVWSLTSIVGRLQPFTVLPVLK